jgi:hypothetical protein
MFGRQAPKAGVSHYFIKISKVKVGLSITFTFQAENCIGACMDTAIEHARKMNA